MLLLLLVLPAPALLEFLQRSTKRQRIGNVAAVELVEHIRHRHIKRLEFSAEFVVVFKTALGNPLHETATGMVFFAEKAGVMHGQPKQRRLQCHDGLAHRHQKARVLRDLIDQLSHHLQTQHLANALGFLLEFGANQGALFGAAIRPPDLLAQLAQGIDIALGPINHRQTLQGRCAELRWRLEGFGSKTAGPIVG